MPSTITPNMQLIVPTAGSQPGPAYATDINQDMSIIDIHDHTPGYGVPITPAGLNINTALTLNGNSLINASALTLIAQLTPATNQSVYVQGVDLYYVDGNGNNVRITDSGGVAGTPGSIANLASPASATYVSGSSTFVWQSNTGIAANMDAGSLLMRNLSPNSTYALTLAPPAALSANYTITLPSLPISQKIMTLDSSGNMTAPYVVDNITLEINTNTIQVKDNGISTAKIADGAVTTPKIADANVTNAKMAANSVGTSNIIDSNVTTAKIADASITYPKLAPLNSNSGALNGSGAASVGLTTTGASRGLIIQIRGTNSLASVSQVRASNNGTVNVVYRILVDSSVVSQFRVIEAVTLNQACMYPLNTIVVPGISAGAHTIACDYADLGPSTALPQFTNMELVVTEL